MTNQVVIHCQPSLRKYLFMNHFDYEYNDYGELDVVVDDIKELEDEELCTHYKIDYDQVNCVEAYNFTP